ncbi:hypothetical protein [Fluviicola sp.]|jgi:hypothetical protein|uniref:hypothetical protein n=1 Tax=Fluviicola sp. TaxID=1917219 RepID=UPI002833AE75|nr:hypothetical protein [Fluviicola sp.]MDR0801249.1 hypothetical protein [Fluviicola sp.]
MEIKRKISTLIFGFMTVSFLSTAQIIADGEREGLLQTTASIYPSQQLNTKGLNLYLGGYLNYHFDDKYSFRGDIYQFIGAQIKPGYVNDHLQVQVGFMRYFPVKRLDPFVGFQVGFSAIQTNERSERIYNSAFAVKAGLNYHVYKFFYFFLECQYIHQVDPWHARPLDQFMGTGGLGFQLPVKNIRQ